MMDVTIWGSRGSVPVSGAGFARHGGATTCVEVALHHEDEAARGVAPPRVILDCGTGLAELGKRWGERPYEALMLQTHMHWDHIQGFPFFGPLFMPGARFDLWATPREGRSWREVLDGQMARPTFPVGLDIIPARLGFRDLPAQGRVNLDGLGVSWAEVWHPSGSTAFRLDWRGRSVVFTGDVEVAQGSFDALVELAQGADLLIMDAQYFPDEYPKRRGFGHSTPLDAVRVAQAAGVSRLCLTHHDPTHDDARLDQKLALARAHAPRGLLVDNAYDGLVVRLEGQPAQAREVSLGL